MGSSPAWSVVFLPAVFADSIDLKCVSSGEVVIFVTDLLLELSHFGREEFN